MLNLLKGNHKGTPNRLLSHPRRRRRWTVRTKAWPCPPGPNAAPSARPKAHPPGSHTAGASDSHRSIRELRCWGDPAWSATACSVQGPRRRQDVGGQPGSAEANGHKGRSEGREEQGGPSTHMRAAGGLRAAERKKKRERRGNSKGVTKTGEAALASTEGRSAEPGREEAARGSQAVMSSSMERPGPEPLGDVAHWLSGCRRPLADPLGTATAQLPHLSWPELVRNGCGQGPVGV